jgi:enoyl-CoA hydratase
MTVLFEVFQHGIGILQVNRPQVRNALDWKAMQAFESCVEQAHGIPDLRAMIVTGTPDIFIAGGDLKALHRYTSQADGLHLAHQMSRALSRLESLPCPTIAAMDGPARGGGAEIALACDLRVMSETADLGFVQITLGLTPGWGAGQRLLRLVGYSRALEWLATGRILKAEEAAAFGLANRVVAPGMALQEATELAQRIASQSMPVVQAVKRLLRLGLELPPETAAAMEQAIFPPLWAAEEHLLAVEKFVNRK